MLQTCEYCPEWAQWRMIWLGKPDTKEEFTTIYNEANEPVQKKLVKRGREQSFGPFLCGLHKQELEKVPTELDRVFRFIGAARVAGHS